MTEKNSYRIHTATKKSTKNKMAALKAEHNGQALTFHQALAALYVARSERGAVEAYFQTEDGGFLYALTEDNGPELAHVTERFQFNFELGAV